MIDFEKILSVSELNNLIKRDLESNFNNIVLEGEISNFVSHTSGHKYFSLKDSTSQISAVMWKGQKLDFNPANGQNVIAIGSISVYPPRGNYQIQVSSLIPKGLGDLFIELEKLKEKLKDKNYFSIERKRKIPPFPERIGISTSPTGAAIRDIISTIERRYPIAEIIVRPTIVQGDDSADDIVKAIKELNNFDCDVLIVGRGGGSIEDLWSYNSEKVADAIFNSKTPVISAVGHETDFTISDLVADVRAATPTAAAEISTPILLNDIYNFIYESKLKFDNKISKKINQLNDKIKLFSTQKSKLLLNNKLNLYYQQIDYNELNLHQKIKTKISEFKSKIENNEIKIKSLDPSLPLRKGYAFIELNKKKIGSNDQLKVNDKVKIIRLNQISQAIILDDNQKQIF